MKQYLLFTFLSLIIFNACNRKYEPILMKFGGETQGTYYAIAYYSADSLNLQPQIDSLLHRFDSSLSTYKPNSIISRMNRNDSSAIADDLFTTVWNKAMEISTISDGAFDCTVGPLVNAWGFGFTDRMKVSSRVIDSLLPLVDYKKVKLVEGKVIKEDPRITFDFNAIAQGYAVDVVGDFLESNNISDFLIDIGGEVLGKGQKADGSPWSVAIEKPAKNSDDERKIEIVLKLSNRAISTSGNYRKYYEDNGVRYSHTINPATGYPVEHSMLSASVIASDCMTADAFATVFMVWGIEKSKAFVEKHKDLEAYFIYVNSKGVNESFHTSGFDKLIVE